MSWSEIRLTRVVKRHDPKLFVKKNRLGTIQVLREGYSHQKYEFDGIVIHNLEKAPRYIMSLTKDWTANTENVDWGVEPIIQRLKDIDTWHSESEVNQLEKLHKLADESKERDLSNKVEDFAHEWRPTFKKAFSDVNVSTMSKKELRKINKEIKGVL